MTPAHDAGPAMTPAILAVTTTVASLDEARALARVMVEARLAACVQIVPVESVYRWQDGVETAHEHLLVCKVRAADYLEVEAAIRDHHAYEVPEIVAVPVAAGAQSYLDWIMSSTTRKAACRPPDE